MPFSELDWLLDGGETGLPRFDGNGYGVQHNMALTWIWPGVGDLAYSFDYPEILRQILHHLLSNTNYSWNGLSLKPGRMGWDSRARSAPLSHLKVQAPGTGLGLAILDQYLQLLKGDISFDSDPEVGTRFTVSFPLSTVDLA